MKKLVTQLGQSLIKLLPVFLTYAKAWYDARKSAKLKKLKSELEYEKKLKTTINKLDNPEHLDWVRSKSFRD